MIFQLVINVNQTLIYHMENVYVLHHTNKSVAFAITLLVEDLLIVSMLKGYQMVQLFVFYALFFRMNFFMITIVLVK
jgi:hypothetical protein